MQVQGAAIGHILDEELRTSAKSKQGSVASHFNNFSKLSGIGKKLEQLTFEDITDDLVGKFANYLVEKATLKCQEGAALLMWNSIAGYFSAFKMFVVRKFHSQGVPRPLDDSRYKLFTREMRGKKVELCQTKGEEWVKPHDQASDEDNMALGLCIFWEGSIKGAEFYHLYRAMVNNAGRGSEISVLRWDHVTTTRIKQNDGTSFHTPMVYVKRLKVAAVSPRPDEVIHYVHCDSIIDDYLFAMCYHLVLSQGEMVPENEECYIFCNWYKHVSSADGSRTESTVSKAFRDSWMWVHSIAANYLVGMPEDFDEAMAWSLSNLKATESVHCGKKRGLQIMGDSFLSPQHLMGRAGWALKTFNTFFDYWVSSKASMAKSGKVISNWKTGESTLDFASGVPPTFTSCELSRDRINIFVANLVGHCESLELPVKHILVANMLRWYKEFKSILVKEPTGKYLEGRDDQHPFIIAVRNAYILAGISDDEFEKMQADVERGFYEANAYSIPDFLQKLGPSNIVDVPANITLRDWILMSNRREQALLHQVFEQRQQLMKVETMLAESREENKKTNAMLVSIMEHLNINTVAASEASLPSAMPEVYKFSDILNAWNNSSLDKVMFKYLFYDAETSYASLADKGPYKSSFSSRKNCMTIFHKYSNIPLVPPPRTVGADISKWRMETEEAIADAAQSIKLFLIGNKLIHENESITVTKLTTKKIKDALLKNVTP